jgi:hypothetical protein
MTWRSSQLDRIGYSRCVSVEGGKRWSLGSQARDAPWSNKIPQTDTDWLARVKRFSARAAAILEQVLGEPGRGLSCGTATWAADGQSTCRQLAVAVEAGVQASQRSPAQRWPAPPAPLRSRDRTQPPWLGVG